MLGICTQGNLDWVVVGQGSNLLVSDDGFKGVVMALGRDFKQCFYDAERHHFVVGCAVRLSRVVQEALKGRLSGLEFAVGTPGTLGGAVRMNAGSRDEWLGAQVVSVTTCSPTEGLKHYRQSDIVWEYRHSSIPADEVIVECVLHVQPGNVDAIRGKMETLLARRKENQPLRHPSCGSVFRNPEGKSAGALIEGVGLKGLMEGGAQISDMHANFIINKDNARALPRLRVGLRLSELEVELRLPPERGGLSVVSACRKRIRADRKVPRGDLSGRNRATTLKDEDITHHQLRCVPFVLGISPRRAQRYVPKKTT
ncbi:MAG: UDP-N-acetylmuramate dehydrogenase, partial [Bacilli bacterium]